MMEPRFVQIVLVRDISEATQAHVAFFSDGFLGSRELVPFVSARQKNTIDSSSLLLYR
jgi:hypothetical protein